MTFPLDQPCRHLATPQEGERDPGYTACAAAPGEPCRWARRYDGAPVPPFHAERFESFPPGTPLGREAFEAAVLGSGLI